MYIAVDFFKHDWHALDDGGKLKCVDCHSPGQTRNAQTAKKCIECHPKYEFSTVKNSNLKKYYAPSYTDALHKLCVSCHTITSIELKDKPKLAECATCHESELPQEIEKSLKWEITLQDFNRVILPVIDSIIIRENNIQMDVEK